MGWSRIKPGTLQWLPAPGSCEHKFDMHCMSICVSMSMMFLRHH
jgi:hypothetical protein